MNNAYGDNSNQYQDPYNDEVNAYADADPEVGKTAATTTSMSIQSPVQNKLGWFARIPIPLSLITCGTALWLILGSFLDIFLTRPELADFIIDCYFIFFGFCFLLMVMPTAFTFVVFLEAPRSGVEKWTRFITTHWGRGYFMIFICILAFGRNNFWRISMGIILLLTGILSIWCGRLAAQKYNRLREYLAAGKEGDGLVQSIKDLTSNVMIDEKISESGLKMLVINSGRSVTNSEVHAIFCFFDRERRGKVELKNFTTIIVENHYQKSL